jgi:ketosteroid isomerase-like protein
MSETNVELAQRAYAYWAAGDVDAMIENATPDFEFIPAIAAGVEGGSVKGPGEFRRFWADLQETWETFRVDVDEFRDFGDRVLGIGRLTAKGRGSELELDQPIFSVASFRHGKVARMQSFLDESAALEAAEGRAAA